MTQSPESYSVPALLPCPFCGVTPELNPFPFATNATPKQVSCRNLEGCRVRPYVDAVTDELAIAEWNRRAPSELTRQEGLMPQQGIMVKATDAMVAVLIRRLFGDVLTTGTPLADTTRAALEAALTLPEPPHED